jgi:replicative DNA helicase
VVQLASPFRPDTNWGSTLYYEEYLVAGLIVSTIHDLRNAVLQALRPEHFADDRCRLVFREIQRFAADNPDRSVDISSLYEAVKRESTFANAPKQDQFPQWVARIVHVDYPIPRNGGSGLKEQATLVFRRWLNRTFRSGIGEISDIASDPDTEYVSRVQEFADRLASIPDPFADPEDPADEVFETLDRLSNGNCDFGGVATGLSSLDEMIGGYQRTELVILGARPSVGKSAFAQHAAVNAAKQGKKVLFFSFEMSRESIRQRLFAHVTGVPINVLKRGHKAWSPELRERVIQAADDLSKMAIEIIDDSAITIADVERIVMDRQADFVIIDYLQIMTGSGDYGSRQEEVADMSRRLKKLAGRSNAPVLALSQLNRSTEDKLPQLHNLRESGSIEQDANVVMFLHCEQGEMDEPVRSMKIHVAKNRMGAVGIIPVRLNAPVYAFNQVVNDF